MLSGNTLAFRKDRKGVPDSTQGASSSIKQCWAYAKDPTPALLPAMGTQLGQRLTGMQLQVCKAHGAGCSWVGWEDPGMMPAHHLPGRACTFWGGAEIKPSYFC